MVPVRRSTESSGGRRAGPVEGFFPSSSGSALRWRRVQHRRSGRRSCPRGGQKESRSGRSSALAAGRGEGAGLAERWRGRVRVQIWDSGAAAGREGVKRAGFRWKEAPARATLGGDARGAVIGIWRAVVRSSRPAFGSKVDGAA
ncbi:proline-rich receptor-like protein kinase PERK2 [Iris pallida]|uniref:Proline-rich receptor-like protein kinase PERK2 n=1 Tax=Iris pallida TaxID=29817 RepID=A0AAX6FCF8_IRIPA|nr:proline-rich receptor-like protein kinase PERK2 [Iris pallida]